MPRLPVIHLLSCLSSTFLSFTYLFVIPLFVILCLSSTCRSACHPPVCLCSTCLHCSPCVQSRTRGITAFGQFEGQPCAGSLGEKEACSAQEACVNPPAPNCSISEFQCESGNRLVCIAWADLEAILFGFSLSLSLALALALALSSIQVVLYWHGHCHYGQNSFKIER